MRVAPIIIASMFVMAGTAHAAPFFTNDFSSNTNGFTTGTGVGIVTAPLGEKFLQLANYQSATTLTLDTSAYVGGSLQVDFSLYVVGSMDGTGPSIAGGGGGDFFTVTSGSATLFNYAFANYGGGNLQTYPTPGSPPATGATSINKLGYSGFPDSGNGIQDSIYNFSLTFAPTSASTSLVFTSLANEGPGNEFYGIDNVAATGTPRAPTSNVPEPASWLLMIAGFGMVGTALRSWRADQAARAVALR